MGGDIGDVHKNISLKFFHIFWCSFFKDQLEGNSMKRKHLFTIRLTGTYKLMYVPKRTFTIYNPL